MTENIHNKYNSQKTLRLSSPQAEYLKGDIDEVPGTYSKSNIEQQIRETHAVLPDRLELLFEDVRLFDEARFDSDGPLTHDDKSACWHSIIGLDENASDDELRRGYLYSFDEELGRPHSSLVEFGEKLGRLADNLALYTTESNGGVGNDMAQIVHGFINGLALEFAATGEFRREFIDSLTDMLERKHEELAELEDEEGKKLGREQRNRDEARERVKEILKTEDFSERGNNVDRLVLWVIEELFDRPDDLPDEMRLSTPPADEDWSLEEEITRERVMDIVEEKKMVEQSQALSKVGDEFERLSVIESEVHGIEAFEIMEVVHDYEGDEIDTAEIDSRVRQEDYNYERDINEILDEIGEEIVQRAKRDREGNHKWKITELGAAVACSIADRMKVYPPEADVSLPGHVPGRILEQMYQEPNGID